MRIGRLGIKKRIQQILKWLLPARVFAQLQSVRARKHSLRIMQDNGLIELSHRVVAHFGTTVLRGPFSGLRFPLEVLWELPSAQRLVGSYEEELHPVFQNFNSPPDYECVVDIGCAEGYYAVGLALRLNLPVFAFDVDPGERRRCRMVAELNGVGPLLHLAAYCDQRGLRGLVQGKRCFVVSDCEGYEMELFNSALARDLRYSDVLIEVHENEDLTVCESLCERFMNTHSIRIYEKTARDAGKYPELGFLGEDAIKAIEEWRDMGPRWVFLQSLVPKTERH